MGSTLVPALLAMLCLLACQPDDTRPGIEIFNDTNREVGIWYEMDGVEVLQRASSGEMSVPPNELRRFRFDFPDNATTNLCTDRTIRARVENEIVASIPPSVCADGEWLSLSEWPP